MLPTLFFLRRSVVVLSFTAVLSGIATLAPALAQEGGLEVSQAWIRAMPPGQPMTAAYLTLTNTGTEMATVTGVSTALGSASIHETRVIEGRSSMRAVERLEVPGHTSITLQPGGLHIMLMGLKETPREGAYIELCLHSNLGESCADVPVQRGPGAADTAAPAMHRH